MPTPNASAQARARKSAIFSGDGDGDEDEDGDDGSDYEDEEQAPEATESSKPSSPNRTLYRSKPSKTENATDKAETEKRAKKRRIPAGDSARINHMAQGLVRSVFETMHIHYSDRVVYNI